ncbi:MAG: diguanylate cyclase domain-containing protein [Leptospirales bacterium]
MMEEKSSNRSDRPLGDRLLRFQRFTEALSEADRLIMGIPDPQTLFERLGTIMVESAQSKAVWIGLVDETTGWIDWRIMTGVPEELKPVFRISVDGDRPEGTGITSEAVRTGQMVVWNDYLNTITHPRWREILTECGFKSVLAVPFRASTGRGIFALSADRVGFFDPELVSLITKFADNITFALSNWERECHRRSDEERILRLQRFTRSLAEINTLIMRRPDPGMLFDSICRIVVDAGQARSAAVGEIDRESGWVRWGWSANSPDGWMEKIRVHIDPSRPEGRTMTSESLRSGAIWVENDYLSFLDDGDWRSFVEQADIRSVAVVPFQFKGKVTGVLGLSAARTGFFEGELLPLLEQLGNNITFALENYDREEARKRDEERILTLQRFTQALAETNALLMQVPDPDLLFETVCRIVVEAGKARAAWIGVVGLQSTWVEWKSSSGTGKSFFDEVRISIDPEVPEGHYSTSEALRTGLPQIVDDYSQTRGGQTFLTVVQECGLKSLCCVPFMVLGKKRGVLVVASDRTSFFGKQLVELLVQLTENISFGLENWEREKIRKSREREIEYLSATDDLTGLPNRRRFWETFRRVLTEARQAGTGVAVAVLDLDGFKKVNDQMGHLAGDRLLREISQNLRDVLRQGDVLARVGGDEFGIILPEFGDQDGLSKILDRILPACESSIEVRGGSVRISVSIGVALFPDHGDVPEELFRLADQALYQVKGQGKGGWLMVGDTKPVMLELDCQGERRSGTGDPSQART